MVVEYDIRPRTQYIVSPHERPGRGDDRAARGTDARRARQNPSCGFYRNFGAHPRSAMPHERVVLDPSQHHAHIAALNPRKRDSSTASVGECRFVLFDRSIDRSGSIGFICDRMGFVDQINR